ncbi:rhodanese-like domain-containing protein [Hydrogenophaga defluvii]|uniref:Rhodanese-like domain-containing protein n=1 Tax=Hydrogenophaga defluvii TaxID=249410 RepID=A0ABW2SFE8_9BURK
MKHLLPTEAWGLLQQRRDEPLETAPLFVDVRMEIESLYVGRPPGVVNIPWYEYPDLMPDPARFVRQVEEESGDKARTVLLICRSGKRTVEAGQALEAAGFTDVVNILHGFEGELDEHFKRSTLNGWRKEGLPWEQM